MGEADREAEIRCPTCKRKLPPKEEHYGLVYVCEDCGWIMIKVSKIKKGF